MPRRQKTILQVAVPVPLRRVFDYLPYDDQKTQLPKPGTRLKVPFGRSKTRFGMLVDIADESDVTSNRLKKISAILDKEPLLPRANLELLKWAAEYYHYPLGEAIFTTLPSLLRQGKPAVRKIDHLWRLSEAGKKIDLNDFNRAPKQRALLNTLHANPQGMSMHEVRSTNYYPAVKALAEKGLIEKIETEPPLEKAGPPTVIELNDAQKNAADSINSHAGQYRCFLLDGVTGSGKTEVYIDIIKRSIASGKQAILLVPEIGLMPQIISRLSAAIHGRIAVLHSALSASERMQSWLEARDGIASVVLGTRSAIWAPLKNPGVIIIDEEHDLSYKQQDGFRYSARDVAIMRGKMETVPVVLGSATPSMESIQNINSGKFEHLTLPQRAGSSRPPSINIIDLRGQKMFGAISATLRQAIDYALARKQQVLLFLNRRGFSPMIMCHGCGWAAKCKRCDIPMTYHKQLNKLSCHHCDSQIAIPQQCPDCSSEELLQIGHGTERLTETLQEIYPQASILRIDRDSTRRKGAMQKMVDSIHAGEADILIGTQMLAKGHHFPNLTLVGIVDADRGLFSADFRTSERMAQLFVQVSGRAGRRELPGAVLVQTHYPAHPLLQSLLNHDYENFAKVLLSERKQTKLPPFSYLALLRAEAHQDSSVRDFLSEARSRLKQHASAIEIYGPIPAPMERRAGRLRFQLLIQANNRNLLKHVLGPWSRTLEQLPTAKKVRWSLDVDPQDML